jgi:hypothetical protein
MPVGRGKACTANGDGMDFAFLRRHRISVDNFSALQPHVLKEASAGRAAFMAHTARIR